MGGPVNTVVYAKISGSGVYSIRNLDIRSGSKHIYETEGTDMPSVESLLISLLLKETDLIKLTTMVRS